MALETVLRETISFPLQYESSSKLNVFHHTLNSICSSCGKMKIVALRRLCKVWLWQLYFWTDALYWSCVKNGKDKIPRTVFTRAPEWRRERPRGVLILIVERELQKSIGGARPPPLRVMEIGWESWFLSLFATGITENDNELGRKIYSALVLTGWVWVYVYIK